jgi:hypothetical protein
MDLKKQVCSGIPVLIHAGIKKKRLPIITSNGYCLYSPRLLCPEHRCLVFSSEQKEKVLCPKRLLWKGEGSQ